MFQRAFLLVSLAAAVCGARAEVFVVNDLSESIAVYDNTVSGRDVAPKRVLKGNLTGLDDPWALQVYTGLEPESASEIFTCNRGKTKEGIITVHPVGASGNASPTRTIDTVWPCKALVIQQDEIYSAPIQGGESIEIYDFDAGADGEEVNPKRSISTDVWLDSGVSFFDVALANGELFVLARPIGDQYLSIYVFDAAADGVLAPKRVINGPALDIAWKIDVFNDEIYVGVDGPDDWDVITFDINHEGLGPDLEAYPLRTIQYEGPSNGSDFLAHDLMVVGGELYLIAFSEGVVVLDSRSGGIPAAKRVMFHEELGGAFDIYVTPDRDPVDAVAQAFLEEPVDGGVYSGIGNLRGWAIANEGVDRVEILIDGEPFQDAPYGGSRGDVGGAFPTVPGSSRSGFSLAFNYNSLDAGEHIITARAHTVRGQVLESSATFEAVSFGSEFISNSNLVKLDGGVCEVSGNSASIVDILVDGTSFDIGLQWGKAAQGFEIVSIEQAE